MFIIIFEVLRIHFSLSCKGEGGDVKGIQYVYNYIISEVLRIYFC